MSSETTYDWQRPKRQADVRWKAQAACSGVASTPELARIFHPEPGDDVSEAMATCKRCSVRGPCLEEGLALPRDQDLGIRAGTTRRERLGLRSRARREGTL